MIVAGELLCDTLLFILSTSFACTWATSDSNSFYEMSRQNLCQHVDRAIILIFEQGQKLINWIFNFMGFNHYEYWIFIMIYKNIQILNIPVNQDHFLLKYYLLSYWSLNYLIKSCKIKHPIQICWYFCRNGMSVWALFIYEKMLAPQTYCSKLVRSWS